MKKSSRWLIGMLLALSLSLSVGSFAMELCPGDTKYTLYIGLNDKDTYTQQISLEQARHMVDAICIRYTGGYTCMTAEGGWVDETGTPTQETSLVYTFSDVTEAQLEAIMDEVLVQLNQNSILMERAAVESVWYIGK